MCHNLLGELDAVAKRNQSAEQHYNEALRIARSISNRTALMEILTSRGRWLVGRGEYDSAITLLSGNSRCHAARGWS